MQRCILQRQSLPTAAPRAAARRLARPFAGANPSHPTAAAASSQQPACISPQLTLQMMSLALPMALALPAWADEAASVADTASAPVAEVVAAVVEPAAASSAAAAAVAAPASAAAVAEAAASLAADQPAATSDVVVTGLFAIVVVLLTIVSGGVLYLGLMQALDKKQEMDDQQAIKSKLKTVTASGAVVEADKLPVAFRPKAKRDKSKGFGDA